MNGIFVTQPRGRWTARRDAERNWLLVYRNLRDWGTRKWPESWESFPSSVPRCVVQLRPITRSYRDKTGTSLRRPSVPLARSPSTASRPPGARTSATIHVDAAREAVRKHLIEARAELDAATDQLEPKTAGETLAHAKNVLDASKALNAKMSIDAELPSTGSWTARRSQKGRRGNCVSDRECLPPNPTTEAANGSRERQEVQLRSFDESAQDEPRGLQRARLRVQGIPARAVPEAGLAVDG